MNPILSADFYTVSSNSFVSEKAREHSVYNFTNRYSPKNVDEWYGVAKDSRMVLWGLSYFIEKYLSKPITSEHLSEAIEFMSTAHSFGGPMNFDHKLWAKVVNKYNGYLPIRIQALPEGSVFFPNEPVIQVTSMDKDFGEIAAHIEARLVGMVSIGTACATLCRHLRKMLKDQGCPESILPFMVHNFGSRACSSEDEDILLGMAHLLSFSGTDNTIAALYARRNGLAPPIGSSIHALAHRIVQSHDCEASAFLAIKDNSSPRVASYVADCYNYNNAVNLLVDMARVWPDDTVVIRPDCYDEKTEILTSNGWKFFKDLTSQDLVAQFNNDKTINFVKPSKIINQKYSGKMIHFTTEKLGLDLLVTPNHRLVTENKKHGLLIKQAEDIKFNHNYKHLSAGKLMGFANLSYFDRLRIAFQADGDYATKNCEKNKYTLEFNFKKKRKIDRLISILKDGGFNYKTTIQPARPENTVIYVYIDKDPSKTFDWINYQNISYEWCQEFIEEISYWDGCRRSDTRFKYDSTIALNSEVVQTIAILAGYRTKYSIYKDNRKKHFSDVHTVHIVKKDYIDGQSIKSKKVNYNGRVYCVTVPSGMVVIRRNNCVSISGNSGDHLEVIKTIIQACKDKELYTTENGVLIPKNVKFIYGDSVNPIKMNQILNLVQDMTGNRFGWGIFGVGGFLRNNCTRDTLSSAYKLAAMGNHNEPVVKLSEVEGKLSIPGPSYISETYRKCEPRVALCDSNVVSSLLKDYYLMNRYQCEVYKKPYMRSKDLINVRTNCIEKFDEWDESCKNNPDFGLNRSSLCNDVKKIQDDYYRKHRS